MPDVEHLRAWAYNRQLLGGAGGSALEALERVVAVYSSHPTAPLALLSRCATLDAEAFAALEERRQAVRLPAMRASGFLEPAHTAPKIFAATRTPLDKLAPRFRYQGFSLEDYERLKPRILECTREPATTEAIQQALGVGPGIMTLVRVMSFEGLVLRLGGSLRSDNLRYVATEPWLGHPLETADAKESQKWLAEQYLRGYGPARVQDFAWWAGLSLGKAKTAMASLELADTGGGWLLLSDECAPFEAIGPVPADTLDVLPKWDALTMGYASDGRQRLVDDGHLGLAYTSGGRGTNGDGLPLLLRGGRAVASWSHRFAGNRMLVSVTAFEPGSAPPELWQHAFDRAASLLGASGLEVSLGDSR